MPPVTLSEEGIREKLKAYSNFKTPGLDKIPNFWLKKTTSLHGHYVTTFSKILNGEEETPEWLTTGKTTLIPKSNETRQPSKYRPICCLSTTYKWLTGIVADANT